MRNKQPFYHRAVVLFTATREIDEAELTQLFSKIRGKGILTETMVCEEVDSDAGDPADLV